MTMDQSVDPELELKRQDIRIKKWDLLIKGFGAIAVLFSIWFTYHQYRGTVAKEEQNRADKAVKDTEQKEREIQSALRESQKPFLERQLTLYLDASRTAAKLATLENGPAKEEARKRFLELYWGELSLVEDKEVESAMVLFGQALTQFEDQQIDRFALQTKSFDLAHSCRKSLEQSWGYNLAALGGREKEKN